MSLEKITQKILKDAKDQAQNIIGQAQREGEEIIAQETKKAESLKEDILFRASRQAAEEKKRVLTMAELESRNALLAARQALVKEVFEEALRRLQSLSDQEYRALLKRMFLKMAQGGEEVIVSPADRTRISQDFLEELNLNLSLSSETRPIKGGFILRKGGVEINNSFDLLIYSLREEFEPEIVKILFESK